MAKPASNDFDPNFTITRLMASDFSSLEHRAMLAEGHRRVGAPE